MTSLQNKHAIVTGAGRGIGAAIASTLHRQGYKVTLMGRTESHLNERVAELNGKLGNNSQAVAVDVTNSDAVITAFEKAKAAFGPVDILVNNAGAAEARPYLKTSHDDWHNCLAVNLNGVHYCTRAALPDMVEQGAGRIINIASTAAQKGYAYVAAYTAAKHGVLGLTRALALEFATKGITVNAICPGYTETDIVKDAIKNIMGKTGRSETEARAELTKTNPQGRLIQPQEVADTVLWLCGEQAASITGQGISVAGGEVM
ncbi:SDR family oxidoreductase [Porticoccus sp. W117]|uniref:SDR family NAD(P)-dependent oxidoreductase n=1 Tax=Porticoccus sp. W117 TaxID=3054777 RepID=UPI0025998246|nr:SDR family oxidoreductase [Porticoccus sp. W117]MDM3870480.1 SDR family oxidoreductase [Porticoccus sp. W117]